MFVPAGAELIFCVAVSSWPSVSKAAWQKKPRVFESRAFSANWSVPRYIPPPVIGIAAPSVRFVFVQVVWFSRRQPNSHVAEPAAILQNQANHAVELPVRKLTDCRSDPPLRNATADMIVFALIPQSSNSPSELPPLVPMPTTMLSAPPPYSPALGFAQPQNVRSDADDGIDVVKLRDPPVWLTLLAIAHLPSANPRHLSTR